MSVMLRLLKLVGKLNAHMLGAVALGALGHISAMAIPVLGAYALLNGAWMGALTLAIVCGVLRGIFRYGEQSLNHYIAFKLLAVIRESVFAALRRLCPAKLDGHGRGELVATLTGDIELLEVFYAHTVSPVVIAALTAAAVIGFMGAFHPVFAVIAALGYLTVGAAIPALIMRLAWRDGLESRKVAGELSAFWLDSLRGLAELLQYNQVPARIEEIERRTEGAEAVASRMKRWEGLSTCLSSLAVIAFTFITLAAGFALRRGGEAGLYGVLLPTVTMLSSFGPALALSALSGGLQSTLASGRRVLGLLDEQPETEDVASGLRPTFTGAESRGLTFSYGGGRVLENLSLALKKGDITGIHGKSGAGKSTFLKLLMRFWNAPERSLFISGVPVGAVETAHLRALEGYMTQETDIFHDTIAANIAVGKRDAARNEIVEAAKKAALHDFILTLPQGYDTLVGELGSTLSGGQRQRIGLARAFLSGAPLLLLDEPTSSLDSLNEGAILKALREECAQSGRTVALVSHRASTLGVADKIVRIGRD